MDLARHSLCCYLNGHNPNLDLVFSQSYLGWFVVVDALSVVNDMCIILVVIVFALFVMGNISI